MSIRDTVKDVVNGMLLKKFGLKIYSTRAFGRELCHDMRTILPSPKVMFDVGANVGQTVKTWHKEFPDAEIHSFEPVKRLYDELYSNYSSVASCNHAGAGSRCETLRINYGKHDVSHSFVHTNDETQSQDKENGEDVDVITLDQYCSDNNINRIDVLKIDVEGFENEVIDGAKELISSNKVDLISVELGVDPQGYYIFYPDFAKKLGTLGFYTVGFYDQTCSWNGDAKLLFCNVLFARNGLKFVNSHNS